MEDPARTRVCGGVRGTLTVFTPELIATGLEAAGLRALPELALSRLTIYGNLLIKWNIRMNLTAIRDVKGILDRHIVESVAAAQMLQLGVKTLLDFGSGAGLPGVPIAICRQEISVTLAESQSKKAAFLAETARSVNLPVKIHAGRVEALPSSERFDVVALRAVDKMVDAIAEARKRVASGGHLLLFVSVGTREQILGAGQGTVQEEHHLSATTSILLCSR